MAVLESFELQKLGKALDRSERPWILAAYKASKSSPSTSLEGTLGLLDWRMHGQIAELIKKELIMSGSFALLPSRGTLGKSSLLIYSCTEKDNTAKITKALQKLKVNKLTIAKTTWPSKQFENLQKGLDKEGISWNILEGGKK